MGPAARCTYLALALLCQAMLLFGEHQSAVASDWDQTAIINMAINRNQSCRFLRGLSGKASLIISQGCVALIPLKSERFMDWADHHRHGNTLDESSRMIVSLQIEVVVHNSKWLWKRSHSVLSTNTSDHLLPNPESLDCSLQIQMGFTPPFPVSIQLFPNNASDLWMMHEKEASADSVAEDPRWIREQRIVYNAGWDTDLMNVQSEHFFLVIESKFEDLKLSTESLPIHEQIHFQFKEINVLYLPTPEKVQLVHHHVGLELFRSSQDTKSVTDDASIMPYICRLFGDSSALVLRDIQIFNILKSRQLEANILDNDDVSFILPKVFCGVFTISKHHDTHIKAMKDTWAKKCHGFLVFSTESDMDIPSVDIPHLGIESYMNMWQKSQSIWKYIYLHYFEEFDYFILGGDDMYYIMENLYGLLLEDKTKEASINDEALYMGRKFQYSQMNNITFNSGGPGYILNKVALKVLVSRINAGRCFPNIMHSIEDVLVGACLQQQDPFIFPFDTSDEQNKQRFHHFSPGYLYDPSDEEDVIQDVSMIKRADLNPSYGQECCSKSSIAFHYISPSQMQEFDDFLYRCPRRTIEELYSKHGLGYYSRKNIAKKKTVVSVN